VRADASQLGQVVMNLLVNAADAMAGRAGSVVVETGETVVAASGDEDAGRWLPDAPAAGRYARLLVRDDGCGMAPETLERIFEPFFSTKALGRGLGLSALLGIVERHSGHLRVTTQLGIGTTFEVLLPVAAESAAAASVAAHAPVGETETAGAILVVDDEPMIRSVVRQILEHEGYEVEVAADGLDALTLFGAEPDRFTAAIVDYAMPGIDGNELIRRLRDLRADLPIIQASGWRGDDRDVETGDAVVQLAKPFQVDELLDVVRRSARPRR